MSSSLDRRAYAWYKNHIEDIMRKEGVTGSVYEWDALPEEGREFCRGKV